MSRLKRGLLVLAVAGGVSLGAAGTASAASFWGGGGGGSCNPAVICNWLGMCYTYCR